MDLDDFSTPLASGFDRPCETCQERFRRQHAEMVRDLQPRLDEMDRVRRSGAAEARNAWIG